MCQTNLLRTLQKNCNCSVESKIAHLSEELEDDATPTRITPRDRRKVEVPDGIAQPDAKIPAVPGKSGSSEVYRNAAIKRLAMRLISGQMAKSHLTSADINLIGVEIPTTEKELNPFLCNECGMNIFNTTAHKQATGHQSISKRA